MNDPRFEPAGLELKDSQLRLIVSWADGSRTTAPYRKLRLGCRCAECVDEMTGKQLLDPARVPADVGIRGDPEEVGLYGLRFEWSDGHSTGIYTWERLRALSEPEP